MLIRDQAIGSLFYSKTSTTTKSSRKKLQILGNKSAFISVHQRPMLRHRSATSSSLNRSSSRTSVGPIIARRNSRRVSHSAPGGIEERGCGVTSSGPTGSAMR